ncbi:hypothetical protein [Thalassobaculum salexigens]|uniref:hypothetical protein n=1 Tax=Thalassobaculum salexigens TaxID=455360 RepID=UPI00248EBD10|nr:hypothetical protein [Thalassobaculum salexigens]
MRFVLFNLVVGATLAYLILADRWHAADPLPAVTTVEHAVPVSPPRPAEEAPLHGEPLHGEPLHGEPLRGEPLRGEPPGATVAAVDGDPADPAPPPAPRATVSLDPDASGSAHAPEAVDRNETGAAKLTREGAGAGDGLSRELRDLAREMESRFLAGIR